MTCVRNGLVKNRKLSNNIVHIIQSVNIRNEINNMKRIIDETWRKLYRSNIIKVMPYRNLSTRIFHIYKDNENDIRMSIEAMYGSIAKVKVYSEISYFDNIKNRLDIMDLSNVVISPL